MAELKIKTDEIKGNIQKISTYLNQHSIKWSLITKVFSGDKEFLRRILVPDVIQGLHSVGDSRLSSLKNLKEVDPELVTIYIKPPAEIYTEEVVEYADISMNTSLKTIKALNKAALKKSKIHKIIIMIELGELREGVEREQLIDFYKQVFNLSNIEIIGIGSNLGCMYGVEPTFDKLMQLSLYKHLLECSFDQKLELISGGSSITLPLMEKKLIPKELNHFRIGEAVFFGTSPLENKQFLDLSTDTFNFYANIIELEEKGIVPDGIINEANIGHTESFDAEDISRTSYKAIMDFGMLDVDYQSLELKDKSIGFVGTTSDMTVYDLGDNKDKNGKKKYSIGDSICFKPSYIAVARLLNSKFIEKNFV